MGRKTNLEKIREIVKQRQFQKIQGKIVDGTSARAVLNVYNALSGAAKTKYRTIINRNIVQAVNIAWKLHK